MSTVEEDLERIRLLVHWHAIRMSGSAGRDWMADDAGQEGLLRAWERLEQGQPRPIAVHAARQAIWHFVNNGRKATGAPPRSPGSVSTLTSTSIHRSHDGEEYLVEPDEPEYTWLDQIIDREALRRAMETLPEHHREMVRLKFWEGYTVDEIAERFGVTHQMVSAAINRSYPKLRALLQS